MVDKNNIKQVPNNIKFKQWTLILYIYLMTKFNQKLCSYIHILTINIHAHIHISQPLTRTNKYIHVYIYFYGIHFQYNIVHTNVSNNVHCTNTTKYILVKLSTNNNKLEFYIKTISTTA